MQVLGTLSAALPARCRPAPSPCSAAAPASPCVPRASSIEGRLQLSSRRQSLLAEGPLRARRSARRPARHAAVAQESQEAPPEVDDEMVDSLVALFRARPREEWRRMLSVSAEWPRLAPHVLARLDAQAATAAGEEEVALLRLRRTLAETSAEVAGFRKTFQEFLTAPEEDWESLAGVRRAQLTQHFFEYLQLRISAMDPQTQAQEREDLATAAARLLALVEMHDIAVKDAEQLDESFTKFQDLLAGVSSVEDIDKKLDALMSAGKVDPALLLTTSKMYMSVKESPYTSEEVKDIMAHLYWRMKASMAELQPPEVRILRHLLSMDDPMERVASMDMAFTPGPELTVGQEDLLSTTPERLMVVIEGVLAAYETQRGRTTMKGQAADMMRPAVIERMRLVQDEVRDKYM